MADPLPAASGILDPTSLSFASFAGGATPGSLDEIKRRRAIAQALAMQKRGFPKNIGEGLTSLGEAVGDRLADNKLTAAETAYTTKQAADPLFSTAGPVGAPTPAVAPVPAPMRPPAPAPVPGVPTVPGPRTDAEDPILQRQKIAALLQGGTAQGVPSENPTEAGVAPPQTGSLASDDSDLWGARSAAIGGIETGGTKDPYRTIGEANTKYGRALGKYGVMTANVAPWTRAALGQALTPEQYLASDEAQDAVFKHRFGQYVARFGEEGAARAWFGGPGNINKPELTDAYERLSVGDYGKDYLKRLQGATSRGPTPTGGAPAGDDTDIGTVMTVDSQTGASPDENPPTPTTIRPMTAGGPTGSRVTSTA
ncbi:MAG: hypothetical protein EHM24_28810, partial [Acidobacteria bacterium]